MIRRRKAPRKKTARRSLMLQCDLLVKELAEERDGHKCLRCGKTNKLQAAHIFPKGTFQRMRFMVSNILTMCMSCHIFFAHKDPFGFVAWVNQKFPGLYDELIVWTRQAPKVDLKQLRVALEMQVKALGRS